MLGLERDVQQFGRIRHARDSLERGLRVYRVPGDVAKRLRVVHAPQRSRANCIVRRSLRHRGKLPGIVEPVDRQRGVSIGVGRGDRDADEPVRDSPPQIRILLASREPGQESRVFHAVDGRGPNAHIPV